MAAQGPYSYPAYGPTAPPCPSVPDSQGPYPPPPQYGIPPAGFTVPQQGYAAYMPPTAPMLGQQGGGPTHPQVQGTQMPAWNPNCPPGLEYLTTIDQLLVHQIVELLEALVGFETQNKYEVKNSLGQRIYFAVEESDFCNRMCCGANRAFTIKILDNVGQPIIQFTRPLACGFCCCPCCLNTMEVEAPPGNIIGYVTQEWHPFQPRFNVQDEKHETVLKIKGPCLAFNCFGDVGFEVVSLDESNIVGRITKQWSGLSREMFTDSDSFGIQFPMDLDVKVKAVLLGACLLVDFMYFEQNSGANQGGWQLG